jgi:hypothetical protein
MEARLFRLIVAAALAASLAATTAAALPPTAERAAARMVDFQNQGKLQAAEGKALLEGEFDGVTAEGGGTLAPPDKVVPISPGKAVARIAAAADHPDLYFYLEEKTGGWTVTAFRGLALTGPLGEVRRLLKPRPA